MKRPPAGLAVPILASCLLFTSCDQFFSTNLFQKAGLGQQETPSASTLASMSVSDLQDLADSPKFFDDLAADPSKKTAVLTNLSDAFTPPTGDPATVQAAAALYASVELNTTEAGAVVSGVVGAALTTDPKNLTLSNIVDFLRASLPSDVLADSSGARFYAVYATLISAKSAYDALSDSITASGGSTLSAAELGDAAQGALLSYALAGITTTNSPAGTASDLWTMISTDLGSPTGFSPDATKANVILAAANSPFKF